MYPSSILNDPRFTLLLVQLIVLAGGCSKTHKAIVKPYISDYQEIRQKLRDIADLLPPPGTTTDSEPQELDPPFKLA